MYHDEYFNNFTTNRLTIIQRLINANGYGTYLEIGVRTGEVFHNVSIGTKMSVDVEDHGATTFRMTSDEFFERYDELIGRDKTFDIIFIDGMHEYETCYRDIINSTKHLSVNGTIVIHDLNPVYDYASTPKQIDSLWNGDVYKAFIRFRKEHLDYASCMLYDCDWGIGIIKSGIGQNIVTPEIDDITFEYFSANKQYLMNCLSTKRFLQVIDRI